MKYTVETPFPYRFFPCKTKEEAKQKRASLRRKGIKASIVVKTENGNDYILKD